MRMLARLMSLSLMLVLLPATAQAFDSVEGAVLGDQTPYFNFGGTVFYFPQTMHYVDNRVTLQLGNASADYMNLRPEQRGEGVGLTVEALDGMNFGLWISRYQNSMAETLVGGGSIQTPFGTGLSVPGAVSTDGWGANATGALNPVDASNIAPANAAASRKLDLFWSWAMSDELLLGARLWWGSANFGVQNDDSTGPVAIDVDGQTGTADETFNVEKGTYGNNDFGLSLGGSFLGIPGLTLDGAVDVNIMGVDWSPNGFNDYVEAGGMGFGLNARAAYDMAENWQIGGFVRFANSSLSFEPKRALDGSQLFAPDETTDDTLGDPSRGAPPQPDPDAVAGVDAAGKPLTPVEGSKYSISQRELQAAFTGVWTPNSLARLYGSMGLRWDRYADRYEVGDFWFDEQATNFATLPFFNVGVAGRVFSWLDFRVGASRRWVTASVERTAEDTRIPDNNQGQGAVDPAVPEGNTNANRRTIEESATVDLSSTTSATIVSAGALVHYKAFQISGELSKSFLTDGLNFVSGSVNPLYAWVSFIVDWDYEQDAEAGFGDGTRRFSPHQAAADVPPAASSRSYNTPTSAPQRAPEPAPEPEAEEQYSNPFATDSSDGAQDAPGEE